MRTRSSLTTGQLAELGSVAQTLPRRAVLPCGRLQTKGKTFPPLIKLMDWERAAGGAERPPGRIRNRQDARP